MWTSHDYRSAHAAYDWRDGAKACALYVFTMLALFVQGRLYLSSLSTEILASLNIVRPLVSLAATLVVVFAARERVASIGVTRRCFGESLALGLALGCLLSLALGVSERIATGLPFAGFGAASTISLVTFAVGALEEELCFRGYISTRLTGFFHNRVVASVVTGGLFLLYHYVIFWGVSGQISFDSISATRLVFILLLHFVCDAVYQRTNCIWGAVALHFLYNVTSGMLQFV